jgi:hypothetical protein
MEFDAAGGTDVVRYPHVADSGSVVESVRSTVIVKMKDADEVKRVSVTVGIRRAGQGKA